MNGLELIKHTVGGGVMTASGAPNGAVSLVKNGKIEFENATEILIDKCFDVPADPGDEPLYDNYLIVVRASIPTSRDLEFRLRSGYDNLDSVYTRQDINAQHTAVIGRRQSNQTSGRTTFFGNAMVNGTHLHLYGPNLQQPTATRAVGASTLGNASIIDWAVTHAKSAAYDGISFRTEGSLAITGSLTIYGFTKGTP